jgi:hypothetical protein
VVAIIKNPLFFCHITHIRHLITLIMTSKKMTFFDCIIVLSLVPLCVAVSLVLVKKPNPLFNALSL